MRGLRLLAGVLCIVFGALSYGVLVFATSSRAVQALGLPLIGFVLLALDRWVWRLSKARTSKVPRLRSAMLAGMSFGIVVEGYALVCIADRESAVPRAESNPGLRSEIRSLIEKSSWARVARLGEEAGAIRDPQVLLDIAYALQRLGDVSQAEASYQKAIELGPGNPAARYELARLYDKNNDLRAAAEQYQAALKIDGALPDIHLAYGGLLIRLGNEALAKKHIEKAIALYPADSTWRAGALETLRSLRGGT